MTPQESVLHPQSRRGRPQRLRPMLLALALVAVVLSGCLSGDGDQPDPSASPTPPIGTPTPSLTPTPTPTPCDEPCPSPVPPVRRIDFNDCSAYFALVFIPRDRLLEIMPEGYEPPPGALIDVFSTIASCTTAVLDNATVINDVGLWVMNVRTTPPQEVEHANRTDVYALEILTDAPDVALAMGQHGIDVGLVTTAWEEDASGQLTIEIDGQDREYALMVPLPGSLDPAPLDDLGRYHQFNNEPVFFDADWSIEQSLPVSMNIIASGGYLQDGTPGAIGYGTAATTFNEGRLTMWFP